MPATFYKVLPHLKSKLTRVLQKFRFNRKDYQSFMKLLRTILVLHKENVLIGRGTALKGSDYQRAGSAGGNNEKTRPA
jgi:hypothetical protein